MTPEDDESLPDADLIPSDELDARLRNMLVLGLSDSEAGKETTPGSRPSQHWDPPPVELLQQALPQYEFYELIGRGGMGAVYKARQKSLGRLVAVKVLPGDILDDVDANFVQRFENEARTMARLDHPNIVNVIDFGKTTDQFLYFVMEYVHGTDVAQLVKASGKLPPLHALSIATQVCDALSYAHGEGVIHRDIKPANVLISPDGRVKIADFGLAKVLNQDVLTALTITHMTIGTPDYAAPESLATGKSTDHRADLYAVGVMLYNMLTGEIPRGRFKLPSEKVQSDVSFDEIINHAMETEREDRYQSAAEIRKDLDRIRSSAWVREGEVLGPEIVTERLVVKAYLTGLSEPAMELAPLMKGDGKNILPRGKWVTAVVATLLLVGASVWLGLAVKSGFVRRSVEKTPSDQISLSNEQDDRTAVLMVLGKGGRAVVEHGDGQKIELRSAALLPSGKLTALELKISGSNEIPLQVTAEEMKTLAGLQKLQALELYSTDVSDEMLEVLRGMNSLRTLVLKRCKSLTDAAMLPVAALKNLRGLSLDSSYGVGSAGVLALKDLTQLEELGLSNLPNVDRAVLPVLLRMKKLWWLQVHNSVKFDKAFVEQLGDLPQLTDLYVSIQHLNPTVELERLKGLRRLRLYGYQDATRLTSIAIESLRRSSTIERLELARLELQEKEMKQIASLPWLKSLWMEGVLLPSSGLASLRDAPLERLEIGAADRMFDDDDLLSSGGIPALREIKLAPNGLVRSVGIAEFLKVRRDVLLNR